MPSLASANYHIPADSFVSGPPASYSRVARDLPPLPEETNSATVMSAKNTPENTTQSATAKQQEGIMSNDPEVLTTPYDVNNPFQKLFRQVKSLAHLQNDWNSYGSAAPNRKARFRALRVLEALMGVNFAPVNVMASSDEGVAIFFRSGDKRASIECLNSGEILGVLSEAREAPEVWAISQDHLKYAVSKIQTFLTT